jgi:Protein of unknown function (DUF3499)
MFGAPLCARPGCGGAVAAWLTYAYDVRTVWLDDKEGERAGNQLPMCLAHADGLKVPQGWTRRDRRTARPPAPVVAQLFPAEGDDGPAGGPSALAV